MQYGYPAINVKFADRKRYYEAFDSFYSDGSSLEMTELIAEYQGKLFQSILTYLEKRSNIICRGNA